jgi:hypothetical protein
MAERKQFLQTRPADPELLELLEKSRSVDVSEDELHEQRISFAYGNALGSEHITKESVRAASKRIRLLPPTPHPSR